MDLNPNHVTDRSAELRAAYLAWDRAATAGRRSDLLLDVLIALIDADPRVLRARARRTAVLADAFGTSEFALSSDAGTALTQRLDLAIAHRKIERSRLEHSYH